MNYPVANIERKNSQWSPSFIVADRGNLGLYQYVSEKVDLINPAKSDGRTALDFAAMNSNLGICKFIIKNSADKNPKDMDNVSTLHLAARYGHLEVCKLIFDHVSDENPNCSLGWTPFHEAAFGGSLEMNYMWNQDTRSMRRFKIDGALQLDIANDNSYLEICKLMIENISDKNPSGLMGFTVLHLAAERGQFEICKLIMENLQDKNPADHSGQTPLHFFARHGNLEFCRLALQTAVDKNPQTQTAQTPLHAAARGGHFEVCRLLMENVADSNPINTYGQMPLHESVQSGNVQLCKLLIDNGGDVLSTFAPMYGVTIKDSLVRIAYEKGDLDMCKLLVDNEENCKLNPITRTLFMALMMCMYFIAGSGFDTTWPKHACAAHFLSLSVIFTLIVSPYLLVCMALALGNSWDLSEIIGSNNVHQNSVGYYLIMYFIPPLLAMIYCAFHSIIVIPKFQSIIKRMKGF